MSGILVSSFSSCRLSIESSVKKVPALIPPTKTHLDDAADYDPKNGLLVTDQPGKFLPSLPRPLLPSYTYGKDSF